MLVNSSDRDAVYLEIGTRAQAERADYPDVDLLIDRDEARRRVHAQGRQAVSERSASPLHAARPDSEPTRRHDVQNFKLRHRRRRHRARHLGHARPLDERHRREGHRGTRRRSSSKVAADAAIKGAVITSGKDTFCGGADLTMLEKLSRTFRRADRRRKARRPRTQRLFDESRKLVAALPPDRDLRQAVGRGAQRHRAWAAASNWRSPAITASPPTIRKTRLGLPEIKVGLFPGAGGTQRIARMMPPADALQFLLKGDQLRLDRAKTMKLIDAVVPPADLVHDGEGLDQGRRQGEGAVGRRRLQAAGRPGLFEGRHDDVPGRRTRSTAARPTTIIRRRARSCRWSMRACSCRWIRRCASSRASSRRSCARPKRRR